MSTELPRLDPVKFPAPKGKRGSVVYVLKGKQGKPAGEVIAEMKRLSKKDLFPSK